MRPFCGPDELMVTPAFSRRSEHCLDIIPQLRHLLWIVAAVIGEDAPFAVHEHEARAVENKPRGAAMGYERLGRFEDRERR